MESHHSADHHLPAKPIDCLTVSSMFPTLILGLCVIGVSGGSRGERERARWERGLLMGVADAGLLESEREAEGMKLIRPGRLGWARKESRRRMLGRRLKLSPLGSGARGFFSAAEAVGEVGDEGEGAPQSSVVGEVLRFDRLTALARESEPEVRVNPAACVSSATGKGLSHPASSCTSCAL